MKTEPREVGLSEYVQFAGAMGLVVAILAGSYWFVPYAPGSPGRHPERERGSR